MANPLQRGPPHRPPQCHQGGAGGGGVGPGVSNTFTMVLPIFRPGTLPVSVCTVQYHMF